ncbi:hypothetical protein AGMMS49938_07420 [Fibrobacterales bacterium]|nr:hypothetical protein AGMMS49938_07420 [Fibrobacterales bacterium]
MLSKTFLPYRIAILFLGAIGYGLTISPTFSFWDCGEFIAAADVLGIPHPPGSPLFVLLGRVFILFFGWIKGASFAVNLLSAVSSILCCLLIFEITILIFGEGKKLCGGYMQRVPPVSHAVGLLGFFAASISLFGDTFWFNALEAEVYGIAMLIIMLNIWATLKWNESRKKKWLFLIAYISVLGFGIHTFSLLPLPAIFIFVTVKTLKTATNLSSTKHTLIVRRISHALHSIPRILLPLITLTIIGLSVLLYLPIRSSTEPLLNENNSAQIENFWETINRKQYGEMNMFERALYRRGSFARQFGFSENIGYLGYHLNQWFAAPLGAQVAGEWKDGVLNKMQFAHRIIFEFLLIAVLVGVWLQRKNLSVLLLAFMFVLSSVGLVLYLNMADGTRADSERAARWEKLTDTIPGLPNLTELQVMLKFYFSLPEEMRDKWLNGTQTASGLKILFEKNLSPPRAVHREVRNRDYFFTPAFLFFAIMTAVALGTAFSASRKPWVQKAVSIGLSVAWVIPFVSNFSTHNRSNDYIAHNFAMNILKSVPQNGILITYGDNDTFPLWYMQLVEKYRRDVVVINESLSYSDWYLKQIFKNYPNLKQGDNLTQIVKNNFPLTDINFMLGANPSDYSEISSDMPITGLVRSLGMSESAADSVLLFNLTENFVYGDLNPRGQEANEQTVSIYRYLAHRALDSENRENLTKEQFDVLRNLTE